MTDFWAWVEVEDEDHPILGVVNGSAGGFAPKPGASAIHFQKFDPVTPTASVPGPGSIVSFLGYSGWSGWGAGKDVSYLFGLRYDIVPGDPGYEPHPGTLGTDPHFVRVDTSDHDDLSTWIPDWDNPFYLPEGFGSNPGYGYGVRSIRLAPRTENVAFIARDDQQPSYESLYLLKTSPYELIKIAFNISEYAYSFNEQYVVIQYVPTETGTRVYARDAEGVPGVEVSAGSIFEAAFNPQDFFFTDDSLYIVAWVPFEYRIYDGTPPFGFEMSGESPMGTGLGGAPQQTSFTQMTVHPTREYIARTSHVSLGLGGRNSTPELTTFFGEFVHSILGGEHGIHRDFNQKGAVLISTEDGRDPYGGILQLLKIPSFESELTTPQLWHDIRLRPFH